MPSKLCSIRWHWSFAGESNDWLQSLHSWFSPSSAEMKQEKNTHTLSEFESQMLELRGLTLPHFYSFLNSAFHVKFKFGRQRLLPVITRHRQELMQRGRRSDQAYDQALRWGLALWTRRASSFWCTCINYKGSYFRRQQIKTGLKEIQIKESHLCSAEVNKK